MTSPIRIGSGSIIMVPDARRFRAMAQAEMRKVNLVKQVMLTPRLEKGFRKNAQDRINAVRLTGTVHLGVKLDKGFRREAETEVSTALAGMSHKVTLNLGVDTSAATAHMAAWRAQQERPLRIRVITDESGGRGIRGGGSRSSARSLEPESPFRASGLTNDGVRVRLSAKSAEDLRHQIDALGGLKASVTPRLANDAGRQFQHDMDRLTNSLKFTPNVAGLSLRAPLAGAFGLTAIPALVSQLAGLASAIQEVGQTGLILPGVFAAAGASLATVLVGVSGLKEAYKALDTQEKDSTTTAQSQMATQRQVRDAVAEETRARRDLGEAIVNEQRRQRDLSLQLRGGKLAEAGAILELQEAAEKLRTSGFTTRIEHDQQVLQYEQAYQNLLEVRNRNADLAQDVAKNEKTGVQGSDAVMNATDALTKATERVADATQKMADGSSALAGASAKAQAALDKLSPSAQSFMKNLIAMRPEFRAFSNDVQEDLMNGLTPSFNNLFHSPAIQSNMRMGMKGLASGLNAEIKSLMTQAGSADMGTLYSRIFGGTTDFTKRLDLRPGVDGIMRLGAVGTEVLPRVSDAINTVTTRFDNFINKADKDGSLKRWIDSGLDGFTQLGRIVQNVISAGSGLNRVFGGSFLTNIDDVTHRISAFLNSGRGQSDLEQLISRAKQSLADWKPILMDLVPLFQTAFTTAGTYISVILKPLDLLLTALGNSPALITAVVTAFAAWKTVQTIITPVQGLVQGLGGYMETLSQNTSKISPYATGLKGALRDVGEGAGNLQGKIGNLASSLAIGGPLATAILAGAMVVLDQWMNKQREAERETEQLTQRQNEFASSLDRTTGLITEQSRGDIAKRLSDYSPTGSHGSLTGNALDAAGKLGVGGANGADLVTAALPGGTAQYTNIIGQLRNKIRPVVQQNAELMEMAKANGLSEDDVIDAFLGVPSAKAKYDNALKNPARDKTKLPSPDNPDSNVMKLPGLDVLQRQIQSAGGDALNAGIVGQALSGTRLTTQGGDPNSKDSMARRAANPNVGLPPNSVFGPGAQSFYGDGQYKITSNLSPDDPNMKAIIAAGAHYEPAPPGALDSNNKPFTGGTYTLTQELAQRYMTGVPQKYHTGGPTKAGLGELLDDEFVIHDRGRFPAGTLEAINDGKLNPDDLPHFLPGGPVPVAPPPVPVPPTPVEPPAPVIPPNLAAGLADAPGVNLNAGIPTLATSGPAAPVPSVLGPMPAGAGERPMLDASVVPATPPGFNPGQTLTQGLMGGIFGGGQGGVGGSGGIGGMLGMDASKFGQILMQGLLGFFGIDPQYLGDLGRLFPGLSKMFGGGDPAAMNSAESLMAGYAADGSPTYWAAGSAGTALPDANSTGTGDQPMPPSTTATIIAGGSGTAPSGAVFSANPNTKVGTISGAPNVEANIAAAPAGTFSPLYKPGLNTHGYGGDTAGIPDWAIKMGSEFGLTPSTYNDGGTLHQMGYAFDFTATKDNPDPKGSMNRFSQFITDNLSSQTLQLIHSDPGANGGRGQNWGIAAGRRAEDISPGYYMGKGGYGDHGDHVHWATDVPVVMGDPNGARTAGGQAFTTSAPAQTSPGPQVTNSSSSAPTPLPNTTTAANNGPLPPAQLSPPTVGSPTNSEDAEQVLALDEKGNIVAESLGVAKAQGHTVLGPVPKNSDGIGKAGAPSGAKPPPGTDNAGADIVIPDGLPLGGGGGRSLPGKVWSPTKGVMANVTPQQLGQKLDVAQGQKFAGMDLKARAHAMYLAAGMPPGEWGDFDQIVTHESGWNPKAQNPGSTAHGLPQFLDSTWATVGGMKTDDADTQLRYMFTYLKQRPDYHGSPAAAWKLWQQRHWYSKGNYVQGGSGRKDDVLAMLMGGEFVQSKPSVQMYGTDFHHAVNNRMIDPKAVDALMAGSLPRFAAGGTLGSASPNMNNLKDIQQQLSGVGSFAQMQANAPTPPVGPERSGVQVPDANVMMPGATGAAPQEKPAAPIMAMPPPQSTQPSQPTAPSPLEPEAGVQMQPDIAPAPKSTDHELPAIKQAVTSTATVLGNIAAMAASASGFGSPAAGMAAGAVQQGGKIVNAAINVASSALVGTLTPGTTANPYGQQVKGFSAPNTLMPSMDNSTHYHGDLYAQDMDDFMRKQETRDSVNMQSQLAAFPGA